MRFSSISGQDPRRAKARLALTFLTWTDDGLLRQVVFQGLRQDKPAREVRLEKP
jgi:ATP-dependent DNA ligase